MLGESKTMAYGKHIDEKWQKRWEEEKLYRFDPDKDNKLYCLEMFSYPSGAQLHVGHWYNYGLADIWARAKNELALRQAADTYVENYGYDW